MAISFDKALGVHPLALQLRERRSEILAANLANADTPGYKARDMDFHTALRRAMAVPGPGVLTTTNPRHIAAGPAAEGVGELLYREPSQPAIDGNTVDAQVEQGAFLDNALHYQATLNFLSGRIKGLMSAIRGE